MSDDRITAEVVHEVDPLERFRLKRCIKCGYDLAGLPWEHACPECGETYSHGTLYLVGWSQPGYMPRTLMYWVHVVAYIVVALGGLVFALGAALMWGAVYSFLLPLGFAIVCAALIVERLVQHRLGGDLHLRVDLQGICYGDRKRLLLFRRIEQVMQEADVGRPLHRIKVRKHGRNIWEIAFASRVFTLFSTAEVGRIVMRCTEAEAQALADELRRRSGAAAHATGEKLGTRLGA